MSKDLEKLTIPERMAAMTIAGWLNMSLGEVAGVLVRTGGKDNDKLPHMERQVCFMYQALVKRPAGQRAA